MMNIEVDHPARAAGAHVPTERPRVVVLEDVWGAPLESLVVDHDVIRHPDLRGDPEALVVALADADVVVVRNRTQITAAVLDRCPRLRVVARAGVGLDNIDLVAADAAGVVVLCPLGANARSVAEHSLGLALALARRTSALDRGCRQGGWDRGPGLELAGRTWGLLGAGATGRACGRLAAGLGMRVLAHDPFVDPSHPELADLGAELVDLPQLVEESHVLSIHLPGGPDTDGLVGRDLLARMRSDAMVLNVGRGGVVDEDALAEALVAGRLWGAALDVRTHEPPEPGPLDQLDNVILTPHVAGITQESQHQIVQMLADEIARVLDGHPSPAAVGRHRELRR